ncbi:c-type cytochrome [Amaricoccus solimangrovi]|uniref:Cytochrome c n=1 Tax=Amaricoccus solimangrovi TaxID=2589815 RepID=A0A501X0E6_9RHOB|nr:c-type cytochrome [Amaricoccus solimangrovi]TPE53111.1 cytochrome c [Amaricoccus solimangrovi]
MIWKSMLAGACAGLCLGVAARAETPVERGEYLVRGPMSCGNCHTPQGPNGPDMSLELAGGGPVIDDETMTAYPPNITPAGEVGGWTDAELARAIREGLRPDGGLIGPPMPISLYRGLSDTDVAAIVAFLRTLKPIEHTVPESVYHIPLPPAYGPPVGHVADIPRGPTAEYGAYMAGPVSHCLECHTPMGPTGPMYDGHLGQGGFRFPGPWGVSISANITSGKDGLADFTDDEIRTMITQGVRPDGSKMLPPMPYAWLAKMTPDDLTATVLYLRTLPPLPSVE